MDGVFEWAVVICCAANLFGLFHTTKLYHSLRDRLKVIESLYQDDGK